MKHDNKRLDEIIDKAAYAIRDEQIDSSAIDQSAERVWARVAAASQDTSANSYAEGKNTMNDKAEHIHGCVDFRSLMPDYLEGKLSTPRKLLLEDHSNECIPCRQELKAQRNVAAAKSATYVSPTHTARKAVPSKVRGRRTGGVARWSIAAAAAISIGIAGLFLYERIDVSGRTLAATVDNANGELFVISDAQARPLGVGDQLQKGQTVRTARDSNAVLRLADGSTIDMRERS